MFVIVFYYLFLLGSFSFPQEVPHRPASNGYAVRDADSIPLWHTSDDSLVFDIHQKNGDVYTVISTDSALVLWHIDSLGCMEKRTIVVAYQLLEKLHIKGRNQDEVIRLLGKPNEVYYKNLYVGAIQEDGTFLVLQYYTEQECPGGKPTCPAHCSIRIIIHPRTNKVVGAG